MALNMCESWSNGIKRASFNKKLQKNRTAAEDLAPKPPSAMGLSYTSLLNTSPNLHICTFYF